MEGELNKTEEIVDTNDPNATYITISSTNDLVQLVRESGGQIHVTDDQGRVELALNIANFCANCFQIDHLKDRTSKVPFKRKT